MKILSIVGTRPQFLKLSPIIQKFNQYNIEHIIVHTGQHYDKEMSEDLFKILNLPEPNYLLKKMGDTSIQSIAHTMIELEKICLDESPNKIIVFGDCDSTVAGMYVAKKIKIPLIHIESGMRSYNKDMPEEINRLMVDHCSDLLLCSTKDSVEKLKKENIVNNVFFVGNLQIELLKNTINAYDNVEILKNNDLEKNNFILLTLHREYNANNVVLNKIFFELSNLQLKIFFPVHPRTKKIIKDFNINIPKNIILHEPMDYLNMTMLLKYCKYVITDSGGIQPEAWFLKKKCIIMRSETEWIETLINNNNILYNYETPLNIFIDVFLKKDIVNDDNLNLHNILCPSQNIIDLLTKNFNKIIYIPIGVACKTATMLKKMEMRYFSLPFDYLNCDLDVIYKSIQTNFENLIDSKHYYYNEETNTHGHKLYGRKVFMHYNNLNKYTTYCSRFLFIINNFNNVVFLSSFILKNNETDIKNIDSFEKIKTLMQQKNNNFHFKLFLINNDNVNIKSNYINKDIYVINVNEKILSATHIPFELQNNKIKSYLHRTLHVFYTKFMFVSNDFLKRGLTKDKILNDKVIMPRIHEFKKYYLEWVKNQINKNFICILIIDKDWPTESKKLLIEITHDYKNILIVRYDEQTLSFNSLISNNNLEKNIDLNINKIDYVKKEFKLNLINYKKDFDYYYDYVITTRIDDDDILPIWYVDYLQSKVNEVKDFKIFGGNKGYVMFDDDNICKVTLNKLLDNGFQSIGLSLIQKTNNNIKNYFNIFSFPHHICIKNLPNYSNHNHLFKTSPNIDKNNINEYYENIDDKIFIYNRKNSTSVYDFDNLEKINNIDEELKNFFYKNN